MHAHARINKLDGEAKKPCRHAMLESSNDPTDTEKSPQGESCEGAAERMQNAHVLEGDRHQLLAVFASIDEPVFVYDPNSHELLYVNESFREHFRGDVGRKCHEVLRGLATPCSPCVAARASGKPGGHAFVWEYRNPVNGRWYHCVDKAIRWPDERVVHYQMAVDISARKKAEKENTRLTDRLEELQKQEAVGHLAAGIAHDLNNIFTAMSGAIGAIERRVTHDEDARLAADMLGTSARRAIEMTRSLLAFSRRVPSERQRLDLCASVEETVPLIRYVLPTSIGLTIDTACDPRPVVRTDHAQLQQILLNLAVNARDAMPDGGALRIAVARSTSASGDITGTSRPTACLIVEDTGEGISPEAQARIFDKFFTTKPRGQGTGLGLSIVQDVVHEHGGSIEVQSGQGSGTTFTIRLPIDDAVTLPSPERSSERSA